MTNITPLNNQKHAKLKVINDKNFIRFKEQHLIPVVVQDFIPLASEFPIAFVKNTETGEFTAVAIMGVKPNVNLYCQSNNWPAEVQPASFFNYPFSLARQTEDDDNCFVCIDTNSELVTENNGQLLFDEDGEQTDYLKARTEHLLKVAENHEQTAKIVQFFASNKLLTLKSLNINLGDNQKLSLDGLYVIDESKLEALEEEQFNELRNKGLLPLIYAHLSSMHQIARLARKQINLDKS